MAKRPHSHVRVNPRHPEASGICDRCGQRWNLSKLGDQYRWRGPNLEKMGLRICPNCRDEPNQQERAIILPADPSAVMDAKPQELISVLASSNLTLSAFYDHSMFEAAGTFVVQLELLIGFAAAFEGTGLFTASLELARLLAPSFSATTSMSATVNVGTYVSPSFSVTGTMTADLDQILGLVPSFSDTGTFTAVMEQILCVLPTFSATGTMSVTLELTPAKYPPLPMNTTEIIRSEWQHWDGRIWK